MTEQIPTPTPEQVQQWLDYFQKGPGKPMTTEDFFLAAQAAEWAANEELEACISWIRERPCTWTAEQLRAARRPKPTRLAEEAQKALAHLLRHSSTELGSETIRRALERLQELEGQGQLNKESI